MQFNNINLFGKAGSSGTTKKNDTVNSVAVTETEKSKLDLSYSHKTTFNVGQVIPVYSQEVFPGDVIDIDCKTLIRMSMPSAPIMDAPRYDINFFFVPYKQVWEKFPYLIGTSYDGGAPVQVDSVPLINYDASCYYSESDCAGYMGVPIRVDMNKAGVNISALPFRAYVKIWNEWYRDENLIASADFSNWNNPDSNLDYSAHQSDNSYNACQFGRGTLPSCRLRDYFASSLPFIQKGEVPLIATISPADIQNMFNDTAFNLQVQNTQYGFTPEHSFKPNFYVSNTAEYAPENMALGLNQNVPNLKASVQTGVSLPNDIYQNLSANDYDGAINYNGKGVRSFNITDLRNAIVTQHQNELDARAGTRYYEKLLSYWGVELNPLEIGRTELIGGFHGNLNVNNVVQTAPATSVSTVHTTGSLSALSVTTDMMKNTIHYSVSQYGLILGLVTVRTNITYSQGLPRMFTNISNWDFYNPSFNGISEQPIYKRELYLSETSTDNNKIFGYNQPFAFLKYRYNVASGLLSANANLTMYNYYTYQDVVKSSPTLSNLWIQYPNLALENTMLLNSSKQSEFINDFLADFYFGVTCLREIPAYSIPGVDKI